MKSVPMRKMKARVSIKNGAVPIPRATINRFGRWLSRPASSDPISLLLPSELVHGNKQG